MKLKKDTINYLESELKQYIYIEKDIARVREEILNPWTTIDENIGGGRSAKNVSVTEDKATSLVNDRRLSQLMRIKVAIENVYRSVNDDGKKLMDLYYFTERRELNIVGVANKIHVSDKTAYNIRKAILYKLADELGIMR